MFKKNVIALLVSSSILGVTVAAVASEQKFIYRLQAGTILNTANGEWVETGRTYSGWVDSGGVHSCQLWILSTEQVDWGQTFQQSRNCLQTQQRQATPTLTHPSTGESRQGKPVIESRNVGVVQNQDATGTRDFVASENTPGVWTSWSPVGEASNCGSWTPDPSSGVYTSAFTQTRNCQQEERREQPIYQTWASGATTVVDTVVETQVNNVPQQRPVTLSQGEWENTGDSDCSSMWLPEVSNQTSDFTQTRSCTVMQNRTVEFIAEGGVIHSGVESRVFPGFTESRVVTASAGEWSDVGQPLYWSHTAGEDWSPVAFAQTLNFTQTRYRNQNRERIWTYSSQGEIVGDYKEEDVHLTTFTREVSREINEWEDVGIIESTCLNGQTQHLWSPAISGQTEDFIQTRVCSSEQSRNINYVADGEVIYTRVENRRLNREGSQPRTVNVTQGEWEESSAECSGWFPAFIDAKESWPWGFSQSQNCVWTMGRTLNYTTHSEQLQRSIKIGTYRENRVYESPFSEESYRQTWRHVHTHMGEWGNVGERHSCSEFSPLASNILIGETISQSRTCVQDQKRIIRFTSDWTGEELWVFNEEKTSEPLPESRFVAGELDIDMADLDCPGIYSFNFHETPLGHWSNAWEGQTLFTVSTWVYEIPGSFEGTYGITTHFYRTDDGVVHVAPMEPNPSYHGNKRPYHDELVIGSLIETVNLGDGYWSTDASYSKVYQLCRPASRSN